MYLVITKKKGRKKEREIDTTQFVNWFSTYYLSFGSGEKVQILSQNRKVATKFIPRKSNFFFSKGNTFTCLKTTNEMGS